jgi:hypothetical protein
MMSRNVGLVKKKGRVWGLICGTVEIGVQGGSGASDFCCLPGKLGNLSGRKTGKGDRLLGEVAI